jgi:hypothetical protein
MPAIITDNLRRETTQKFLNEFLEANTTGKQDNTGEGVWIGLGRSQEWSAQESTSGFSLPYPGTMQFDEDEVKRNLQTLVRATIHTVLPRNRWISGRRYKRYDPTDWSCFYPSNDIESGDELLPCYIENNGNIYLVLDNFGGAQFSTLPSLTTYGTATGSNYRLLYLTSVPGGSPFFTNQFIEIAENEGSTTGDPQGLLYGFRRVSGGSGYSGGTTIARIVGKDSVGNPRTVTVTATVSSGGQVTELSLPGSESSADRLNWTKDTSVFIESTENGTGAKFLPLIGPENGFASNVLASLPSWFIGVSADFEGKVEGAAKIIPFRQISVILNPERDASAESGVLGNTIADEDAMDALPYFVLDQSPNDIPVTGSTVSQGNSRAFFDRYRQIELQGGTFEHRFYFHQVVDSSSVNMLPFTASGDIEVAGLSYTYTAIENPEYVRGTGKVYFIENRSRIDRSVSQTEEVKVIVQF